MQLQVEEVAQCICKTGPCQEDGEVCTAASSENEPFLRVATTSEPWFDGGPLHKTHGTIDSANTTTPG